MSSTPSFTLPPEVSRIAKTLRDAGHEAWCVGGAVRDALLGSTHLDWDLATSATPDAVQRLFKRTIPVGVEFGTVGVLDKDGVLHEVTTFRKDVNTDGRHAVVEFGVSLDDDLARRDFTINAIAYDPASGELRDPFDGRTDLQRGIVRAVGDAPTRMREDRLRALRAIRFAARFGFHIEPATLAAIRESAPHLSRLSAERVKQELEKTMQQVKTPSVALEWWREVGALAVLVPALADAPAVRFAAVDHLPMGAAGAEGKGATLTRLAALFVGAPAGAVEAAVKALKFSNADTAWIVALARAAEQVGEPVRAALASGVAEPRALRRWVAAIGRTRTEAFFTIVGAQLVAANRRLDVASGTMHADEAVVARAEALTREATRVAYHEPIELADLAVDGDDLRRVGVPAGREIGRVLHALLDWVLDDPSRNRVAELERRAKELVASP